MHVRNSILLASAGLASASLYPNSSSSGTVSWLGSTKPAFSSGTTFGLPWQQSRHFPNSTVFSEASGVPIQTWITGYWADGSIKWTGHALGASAAPADSYTVTAATSTAGTPLESAEISVQETPDEVVVDTGAAKAHFAKSGSAILSALYTDGKLVGTNGRLVLHSQTSIAENPGDTPGPTHTLTGAISSVSVSANSSVRALVTVSGTHASPTDAWLPFTLRFYLYANSTAIRILHTVVFDRNASANYISALGLSFDVPLAGELPYNRHVRMAGTDGGLFGEAVQGITGLRRDPGAAVRAAQIAGTALPDISTWATTVSARLKWIPTWADFVLSQLSPDGFLLKKRTHAGQSWLNIPGGSRAGGLAYLGGSTTGGLALGLRDFWKRYPAGLAVANATADTGSLTLWLWSPDAPPLDLRPFHDGLNETGYADELDALEITYEDWEDGFDTPYGIARTSEVYLFACAHTPARDTFPQLVDHINNPPFLVASPQHLKDTQALGKYWDLPGSSSSSAAAAKIEAHLAYLVDFYQQQVEQRRWYGFLDYGDFMHTYDADRHTWRYDIGGYAWDNSELSPDLFFWLYFLRTGRADVFRFAEALTRHTSEVDVYHIGAWKGIGTRHGVQHWGDSAKQARISQPQYRKYFFYLSGGDERIGEILTEQLAADQTYGVLDPVRKVRTDGWTPSGNTSRVAFGLGTDWSSLAGGWLLAWERRGAQWETARAKLQRTAAGIAALKNGFVTGSALYSLQNWTLTPPPADPNNTGLVAISHLNAVFGLPEVVSELIDYFGTDAPAGFRQAWLDYAFYYGATAAEQRSRYGVRFTKTSLKQAHSRLTAYAAAQLTNQTATLANRTWTEFYDTDGLTESLPWVSLAVNGSKALAAVDEAPWFATNDVAQYGLAAIQNLAYVGEYLN